MTVPWRSEGRHVPDQSPCLLSVAIGLYGHALPPRCAASQMSGKGRLRPAAFEAASVGYRRLSPIPVRPSEGLLTEPTAAVGGRAAGSRDVIAGRDQAAFQRPITSAYHRISDPAAHPASGPDRRRRVSRLLKFCGMLTFKASFLEYG
jgi:hypothetical protein